MDIGLPNPRTNDGYRASTCADERPGFLGAGQLPQEERRHQGRGCAGYS